MSDNQVQKNPTDLAVDVLKKLGEKPGKKLGNAFCDLIEKIIGVND